MHYETTSLDKLQAVLDLAGLTLRASEVHGMVCGEICRQVRMAQEPGHQEPLDGHFLRMVGVSDPENGAQRAVWETMEELMDQSRRSLDAGIWFPLLLPGDGETIEERTGSLADWARGFTLALLRGEKRVLNELGGDSAELVRDFLKISEAQSADGSEDDEKALMEIEEYMRVGVQLIFEELQPQARPEQTGRRVH